MEDEEKRKQTPSRRVSMWRSPNIMAPTIPENTYQLGPPRKFKPGRASPLLHRLLTEAMENDLNPNTDMSPFAKQLAQLMRSRMVGLMYRRYKIVVHITMGRKNPEPGVLVASRCAWNAEYDNYASASFEDSSYFATAVAYFLNYE